MNRREFEMRKNERGNSFGVWAIRVGLGWAWINKAKGEAAQFLR